MSLYTFLKFLHVLLAIIAVGFNASYGIWSARASREPQHELHVLKGIKTLDDRFATPAYVLLLVTGISMVAVGDLTLTQFWLLTSLILYGVVILVALIVYTPTLRRQIGVLQSQGAGSEDYRRLSTRSTVVGIFLAVLVIVIVFLMVTKPSP